MERKPHLHPAVLQEPPSVAFIQTRLAETLDAVKDAQVDYNLKMGRFEARRSGTIMSPTKKARLEQDTPEGDTPEGDTPKHVMPVRELVPAVEAMLFWNTILDQAMERFVDENMPEPEKLVQKPEYSIRSKKKWEDIHENLQNARGVFDGVGKAVKSRFKKFYRFLADNTDSVQEIMVLVPDDGAYMSLVKFVLGALFDVSFACCPDAMKMANRK